MSSISSYALLQDFHSRPPPAPLSLLRRNNIVNSTSYPDANAALINLASITAQTRRRKQPTSSSSSQHDLVHIKTHSPFTFNQDTLQRVYSEVMMSTENTPKASYAPAFQTITKGSLSSLSSTATITVKRPLNSRRPASRQRPVSRTGLVTLPPAITRTPLPPTPDSGPKRRGKVLGQALQRAANETRSNNKPNNLSLVQKASHAPSTVRIAAAASFDDFEDEEDEDWAAFITSGYGDFPLPPNHLSPASTFASSSAFLSPLTGATSLPSSGLSSGLPKTGIQWLDDELAWASSDEEVDAASREDEEEKEFVQSPIHARKTNIDINNRLSVCSEIFCTPNSSPQIDPSSFGERKLEIKPVAPLFASELYRSKMSSYDLETSSQAPIGKTDISDRHGSVSSTTSSKASSASAMSRNSSCADSVSTGITSISSHSLASSIATPEKKHSKKIQKASPRRPSLPLEESPILPTRMTSLDHCVESKNPMTIRDRPLLGAWLSDTAQKSTLPSIQVHEDDDEVESERGVFQDANLKSVVSPNRFSRSTSNLSSMMGEDGQLPRQRTRRSSRSTILANCEIASRSTMELDQSSRIYYSEQRASKTQSKASKLRSRFVAMTSTRRTSTPDVPITPNSANSEVGVSIDTRAPHSPSSAIFGSAAINTRASAYVSAAAAAAAAAAASITSSSDSPVAIKSLQQQQQQEQQATTRKRTMSHGNIMTIPKAGFCFDYDPQSPFYLSSTEDSGPPSPTSTKPPPPSSFWRSNNASAHHDVDCPASPPKFPSLRRRGSFRIFK